MSHTLTPSMTKLSFDPQSAFVPVVHIADSAQVLFRAPSFAAESLESMAQMDIVGVPYKGAGPVVTAVVGSQVELGIASLPAVSSFIAAGRVKAIGVSTRTRSASLPDVPTFAEQGVQGYEFNTWFGFLAPRGTPRPIVDRINSATNEALRKPEIRAKFSAQGADPVGGTPEDLGSLLKREFVRWPEALRKANIKGEG